MKEQAGPFFLDHDSFLCSAAGQAGKIHWRNNWVAFMDNMLQLDILSEDTRGLFVPTSLEKLTINAKQHVAVVQALAAESEEVGEYSLQLECNFRLRKKRAKQTANSFCAWLTLQTLRWR
jgi:hypothetical protein